MNLKAGSIDDFANDSMAAAMAEAFLAEWDHAMDHQPKPEMNNQMRLMFVAIAQGVVKHLHANKDAFRVMVKNGGDTYNGTLTSIETDPPITP